MKTIHDVIEKMPVRIHPMMNYVLTIETLIELDESERKMNRRLSNIVIADVDREPSSYLKQMFIDVKRSIEHRVEFVYNYRRAVLCDVSTDDFNFDF